MPWIRAHSAGILCPSVGEHLRPTLSSYPTRDRYVRALRAAGVPVYYKCYYAMHGFWGGVTTAEGATSLRESAAIVSALFGTD